MTQPASSRWADLLVTAGPLDVKRADAINTMLIRPIGLLPRGIGDPIKPFGIGVWKDIRQLLKPNARVTSLRRTISAYTHSKRDFFVCAQPDAYRYDINGNAVAPVSADDRMVAQLAFSKLKSGPSKAPSPALKQAAFEASKSNQIRAGIFRSTQRKTA